MKSKIKIIVVAFFFIITALTFAQDKITLCDRSIDTYITEAMSRWNISGMSVAIIKDGKIFFVKGYGLRELGKPDSVDENTVFSIASNTKAFTGTAIAILESEGKLSLDDNITKYFPWFELYDTISTKLVNVKDVLSHRIGLGTFHGDFITWGTNFTREELMHKIRYVVPEYGFRNGYGYCNSGFLIAGEIIHSVTNTSWDDYIKNKFFLPLKMNRTVTSFSGLQTLGNLASPHTYNYDYEMIPIPWRNVDNLGPAGSICSSAKDMANWILMWLNNGVFQGDTILNKKILRKVLTPGNIIQTPVNSESLSKRHFSAYGLGWFLQDYKGKLLVTHTGGYDGMVSRTAFMPDENLGIVILTNNDRNNVYTSLAYQVFDYFLNTTTFNWDSLIYSRSKQGEEQNKNYWKDIESQSLPDLLNTFKTDLLFGNYNNIAAGDAEIKNSGGEMILTLNCRPGLKGVLNFWHQDTLICTWSEVMLGKSFVPVFSAGGDVLSFKVKVSDDIDPLYYEFRKK
jgi:CubicO group peptidase (beta-lactamase class C family)